MRAAEHALRSPMSARPSFRGDPMARADGGRRPVVIVTGALAPYTQVLYERLAGLLGAPLHVLACSSRETARQWELDRVKGYGFEVLPGFRWHRSSISNLYVNPSVALRIAALRPGALVLNDFSPTMAIAAAVARATGLGYGVRTDGVPETDPGTRSPAHRLLRRAVVGGASFGLGPSHGSGRLLASYGLAPGRFAIAPLFPAWSCPAPAADADRAYDVLFCGRLGQRKGADFFTDVVLGCLARGTRLRVRVVGDGPSRADMERRFAAAGIPARFDGFLQQAALAEAYGSSRLFHFPSRGDVWGIVVQEALQCGTVVMASPHSGAARELVGPRCCGLVLDLDPGRWIEATLALLDGPSRQATLRAAGFAALSDFTPDRSAEAYRTALAPLLDGL